jgi:tetratricopeptide (TPR) repeat protein
MASAQSGPGLVICEPVTIPALSSFGAGCAAWLQFAVGGQPQFGKTPLWGSLNRAASEMHRSDLQLSSAQAVRLAPILGITQAAVGTLRGSEPHLTLAYRRIQVPSGAAAGAPITVTGTQAQITARLPQMARTLALGLGGTSAGIPASSGLAASDLELLGALRRLGQSPPAEEQPEGEARQKDLVALASHSPLASLMALGTYGTRESLHAAVKTLLAQAGGNPLVWAEIADKDGLALLPYSAQLSALAARFPGNAPLAAAESLRCRAVQDRPGESAAAERLTRDAPHAPNGWLIKGEAVSDQAADLRQARVFPALTPAEADTLGHLYPQWEKAAQHAVILDPAFAPAWQNLAKAATFNSDTATADHALQKVLTLSADKAKVYEWGLEMYQPKWGGDPAKLQSLARQAASDTALTSTEVVFVAQELKESGSPNLQQKVLSDFIARRRAYLSAHPDDSIKHWGLAAALKASGDKAGALAEYKTAAALLPNSAEVRCDLGDALYDGGVSDQGNEQFQEAARIDPDSPRSLIDLGFVQRQQGHFEEAKRSLQDALRFDPANSKAYSELGDVFLIQRPPDYQVAIENYQAAIRYGNYSSYVRLVAALDNAGKFDQVLTTGEAALRIYINGNATIYDDMADAYLHEKEWDKSIVLSQAALTLNVADPVAHENLGEAYIGAGRKAEAQAEWRKVLALPDIGIRSAAEGYLKQYP